MAATAGGSAFAAAGAALEVGTRLSARLRAVRTRREADVGTSTKARQTAAATMRRSRGRAGAALGAAS